MHCIETVRLQILHLYPGMGHKSRGMAIWGAVHLVTPIISPHHPHAAKTETERFELASFDTEMSGPSSRINQKNQILRHTHPYKH
jgi:hypothetical protein